MGAGRGRFRLALEEVSGEGQKPSTLAMGKIKIKPVTYAGIPSYPMR